MRQTAAIFLYRALLREARQQFERFGSQTISLRAPLDSAPGNWNSKAKGGLQYQLDTLETLVPDLAVLPQDHQLPLTLQSLRQLIRDNFRADSAAQADPPHQQQSGRSSSGQQHLSPLDKGFAALRALPQQAYLESCSSSYLTEGVLIEATSCFNPRADPYASAGLVAGGSGSSSSSSSREQWFSYRIRVINNRSHCIKVLGRGWVISSALGELEGYVQLAADNGIVGQQPVIPPGTCFEYYSCSSLKRASGPGTMKGHLLVSLLGPADRSEGQQEQQQQPAEDAGAAAAAGSVSNAAGEQQQQQQESSNSSSRRRSAAGEEVELERVAMPVGEFKLQSPATAAAAAEAARARDAASSAGASQDEKQRGEGAVAEEAGCGEGSSSSSSGDTGSDSDYSNSDDGSSRR